MQREMTPGAELDYLFGWADPTPKGPWLQSGETITAHTVTVEGALELMTSSDASGAVTVWVRMPAATALGATGAINCAITTSANRKDSRRIDIVATQR